ncbi:MAG: dihydropyrimidinase [Oscillospiraceae bacterium]|nr:dihydropyrimidinase [Oscillospiraceae bacterium]
MKLLIKNGTIVNAADSFTGDVLIAHGKIAAVWKRGEENKDATADETVDASGLLVLPGAIDAHVHFELPFGNIASADDFYAGTRAAACGAVTTIIDFVTPDKGESLMEAFTIRKKAAEEKSCVDYGFHMSLPFVTDNVMEEMDSAVSAGMSSFKVFMTYAFRVSDNEFFRTLSRCKELGALTMVHAEAHDELTALKSEFIASGKTDSWHHYKSRPESVETFGVRRAIELAAKAGAPLYIVHLASAGGMAEVEEARRYGQIVYAETCPQYLHFTSGVYRRGDGQNFVCSPPIKGKHSQKALWRGIKNGGISTVATDHCPFTLAQKAKGKADFTKTPNGVMGTENLFPYMLSEANSGRITFMKAVELCCQNPAKIFGLSDAKGTIAAGKDADIVLYDPNRDYTITQADMHSDVDYTIWEGVALKGYPTRTYLRGCLIYKDGEFLGKRGFGRYLPRHL